MILVIDQEHNIRQSIAEFLDNENLNYSLASTGKEAMEVLFNHNIRLVIADLRFANYTGIDLIKLYRESHSQSITQFIIISNLNDINTMRIAFKEGITDFLIKPLNFDELKFSVHKALFRYSVLENALVEKIGLHENIVNLESLIQKNHLNMIQLLLKIIQVKDKYSEQHGKRVSELAALIATKLNLSTGQVAKIKLAGLIHDVGKIVVPDPILVKPGLLAPEQFNIIKSHSLKGYDIVKDYVSSEVSLAVLFHHEHVNGGGYPRGLKGDKIPLEAKIIGIADEYDALRTDRPYRKALDATSAAKVLIREIGVKFDKALVHALVNVLPEAEASIYM